MWEQTLEQETWHVDSGLWPRNTVKYKKDPVWSQCGETESLSVYHLLWCYMPTVRLLILVAWKNRPTVCSSPLIAGRLNIHKNPLTLSPKIALVSMNNSWYFVCWKAGYKKTKSVFSLVYGLLCIHWCCVKPLCECGHINVSLYRFSLESIM